MELKIGENINDKFIVCDIRKYKGKKYALLLNVEDDYECFYEYTISENGTFSFSKVIDEDAKRTI